VTYCLPALGKFKLPNAVANARFKCHKTLVTRLLNSNNKPPFPTHRKNALPELT
jgi:hypothetical protein